MTWTLVSSTSHFISNLEFLLTFSYRLLDKRNIYQIILVTEDSFTIRKSLYSAYSTAPSFLLTYTATTSGVSGSSSIVFQMNQLPTNGSCSVQQTSGIALSDYFGISCPGWYDPDGYIATYQYFGNLNYMFIHFI